LQPLIKQLAIAPPQILAQGHPTKLPVEQMPVVPVALLMPAQPFELHGPLDAPQSERGVRNEGRAVATAKTIARVIILNCILEVVL